jgi:1,2-diacylglycerol 3-beta-galactosyltransferase
MMFSNAHSAIMCERRIRRRIASYDPDVIVSVHPTMNRTPILATKRISKAVGKHIPFFTVVTDLGSGHAMWFHKNIERMYVASERIRKLARRRGWTPEEKIVMSGLPIRHDFAVQANLMGNRTSAEGKAYQHTIRTELGLDPDKQMVLVMGGGEGVGSLSDIVNELYAKFTEQGIDATICVVCGRNDKLKKDLELRDWNTVLAASSKATGKNLIKKSKRNPEIQRALDNSEHGIAATPGAVKVIGLGFVSQMAEYMVAADVLVTKAGPGTIAEAAAVGLPVMLTR